MEYERHKRRIKIELQTEVSPYAQLYWGHVVNLRDIKEKAPHCLSALQTLINDGRIKTQQDPNDPDNMLLWSPGAVKATVKMNDIPY